MVPPIKQINRKGKMKNIALLFALLLSANAAYASKSRISSLQGARFLKDSQTIFINPAHINELGEYFTAEFGDTSNSGSPKAEGGLLLKKMGGKGGLYLGHMHTNQGRLRDSEGFYLEDNPVELTYGKDTWGSSLYYSKSKVQTSGKSQSTLGTRFGISNESYELFLSLDLWAESKRSDAYYYKMFFPGVNLGFEKNLGDYYLFFESSYTKTRQDITSPITKTGAPVMLNVYEGGIQDLTLSNGKRKVYYGVSLKYDVLSKDIYSNYNFTAPLVIGIENVVIDWLTLRASLTQNFILGYTQSQTLTAPGNKRDTIANNTSAALGASFKFKEFELDGYAAGSTTGDINGNSLLSKASLTYKF